MAATSTSETWDAAWTLTLRKNRKRLTDNIFDEYPVLAAMRKSGKVEIEDGGKEFQEDVMYAKNTGTWFSGYDTVGTAAVDGITAAFYVPRYISVPVTISMTEEVESNAVGSKKLMEAKQDQPKLTARESVSSAMFGATSGKIMLGLQDIIADNPTTGTVGGINRANESWWRNQYSATSTTFLTQTKTNVFDGWEALGAKYNDCSSGNDQPDLIVTTLALMADVEASRAGQGYTTLVDGSVKSNQLGETGDIKFKKAVVVSDRDCAASHFYLINTKYLKLKIMSSLNFAKTPFKENTDQHAKVAHVVFGGQLTTNNPRRLGVLSNVS